MRIAHILPSIDHCGPNLIARGIVNNLPASVEVSVLYFRHSGDLSFKNEAQLLRFPYYGQLNDFDLVHTHMFKPDMLAYLSNKHIWVSTVHTDIAEDFKHKFAKSPTKRLLFTKLWQKAISKADCAVFLTEFHRRKYLSGYDANTTVINNGLSFEDASIGGDSQILKHLKQLKEQGKTILGNSCRVVSGKAIDQVMNFLAESVDNIHFVLFGDGSHLEQLKQIAKSLSIDSKISFMGNVDRASMYYRYFDFFLFTSYTEGLPVSLIEAASSAIPVICSDLPPIREIFDENEICYFTNNDLISLKNAFIKAQANQMSYANNIKSAYEKKLTASVMSNKYFELYTHLLNKNKI